MFYCCIFVKDTVLNVVFCLRLIPELDILLSLMQAFIVLGKAVIQRTDKLHRAQCSPLVPGY